jgi:hypothetical protein
MFKLCRKFGSRNACEYVLARRIDGKLVQAEISDISEKKYAYGSGYTAEGILLFLE